MKRFQYQFILKDYDSVSITVEIDKDKHFQTDMAPQDIPKWVALEYHKCENCTLSIENHPHCPVALSILELVRKFEDHVSYEDVMVRVVTDEREYSKKVPLQQGISSLMGLIMVCSGCPIFRKLRPMAYFHLPFSTIEETVYRVLSMYLLGQYSRKTKGKDSDWNLKNLSNIYKEINIVNSQFSSRINDMNIGDSSVNGLIILGNFAQFVSFSIDENMFEEIEELFGPYLDDSSEEE